jgi:hypothetical protein
MNYVTWTFYTNAGPVQMPQAGCPRCGPPEVVVVPRELLERVRLLTHPDLHPGKRNEQATKVTAEVNGALQDQ